MKQNNVNFELIDVAMVFENLIPNAQGVRALKGYGNLNRPIVLDDHPHTWCGAASEMIYDEKYKQKIIALHPVYRIGGALVERAMNAEYKNYVTPVSPYEGDDRLGKSHSGIYGRYFAMQSKDNTATYTKLYIRALKNKPYSETDTFIRDIRTTLMCKMTKGNYSHALAGLCTSLFISEVSRCKQMMTIGLMLLDLMEYRSDSYFHEDVFIGLLHPLMANQATKDMNSTRKVYTDDKDFGFVFGKKKISRINLESVDMSSQFMSKSLNIIGDWISMIFDENKWSVSVTKYGEKINKQKLTDKKISIEKDKVTGSDIFKKHSMNHIMREKVASNNEILKDCINSNVGIRSLDHAYHIVYKALQIRNSNFDGWFEKRAT